MSEQDNHADTDGCEEAYREAFVGAHREGRLMFRKRAKEIMESPEAEGRYDMAKHLALETELSVEEALAILRHGASVGSIDAHAAETLTPQ